MAKKRISKKSKSKQNKNSKKLVKRKKSNKKLTGLLRVADIFVIIAITLTLIEAILILIFPSEAIKAAEILNAPAWTAKTLNWVMLSISWIFIALLMGKMNRIIKIKINNKSITGLLILGLLAVILGQAITGSLVIIASLLYYWKTNSKK